jgi:hypothetical protein
MPLAVGLTKGFPTEKKARPATRAKGVSAVGASLRHIHLTLFIVCFTGEEREIDHMPGSRS